MNDGVATFHLLAIASAIVLWWWLLLFSRERLANDVGSGKDKVFTLVTQGWCDDCTCGWVVYNRTSLDISPKGAKKPRKTAYAFLAEDADGAALAALNARRLSTYESRHDIVAFASETLDRDAMASLFESRAFDAVIISAGDWDGVSAYESIYVVDVNIEAVVLPKDSAAVVELQARKEYPSEHIDVGFVTAQPWLVPTRQCTKEAYAARFERFKHKRPPTRVVRWLPLGLRSSAAEWVLFPDDFRTVPPFRVTFENTSRALVDSVFRGAGAELSALTNRSYCTDDGDPPALALEKRRRLAASVLSLHDDRE